MADHGTVAWKWGELSAVGRCAWSVYHAGKAVLWGKAEKASGAPESVCSVSDPVDVGDFCDHRSAPASDLFWQAFPGIWRHRHCSEYWRFPEIYRNLFLAGGLLCIPGVFDFLEKHRKNPLVIAGLLLIFWYSVYFMASSGENPFLYFQF